MDGGEDEIHKKEIVREFSAAVTFTTLPRYEKGMDLNALFKALGYPVCVVHETFAHTGEECSGICRSGRTKPEKANAVTENDPTTTATENGNLVNTLFGLSL